MGDYFRIDDLRVDFKTFEGEKKVLDIGRLEIEKGQTYGLVGESGSGKTVLALAILRLLPVPPGIIRSGQILFKGEDLLLKKESQMRGIRGKSISMIFQDPMSTLNPVFTVGEQITRVIRNNKRISAGEARKEAVRMAELVRLPDAASIMGKYPHELSGGQRQRIIIAIALSCNAEFIIADEPTRNLDVTIQAGILKLIAELRKELKITVLYIANNLGLVSTFCDRVGILHKGQIVEAGNVGEVLRSPVHPYTLTFLNAIPKNRGEKIDLGRLMLSGNDVLAANGCLNFGKCPGGDEACRDRAPRLKLLTGTHYVACHRAFEGDAKDE